MPPLRELVRRARSGDLNAYGEVVEATQATAHAVAADVLRDHASAQDAVQEAYLRAFRRLDDLRDPEAFAGWLRRIVVTVAMNARRSRRATLLRLDDVPEIPVLDEAETVWSEAQRQRLAAALLTLSKPDRQLCDRTAHNGSRRDRGRPAGQDRRAAGPADVDRPAREPGGEGSRAAGDAA